MVDSEIQQLFQTRDKAVQKKDKELFLSTQVDEIKGSGVDGYLLVERMESKILAVISGGTELKKVAVKETYFTDKGKSHEGLLIYSLAKTNNSWKIHSIIY